MIFNGMRIKSGEKFLRNKILMANNFKLGVVEIEPRWQMTIGDKEDLINPWGEFFDTTKPEPKKIKIIAEAKIGGVSFLSF